MSKNKQGYYLRARTVPSNPNTLSQQAIRTAFSALTPAWSSLTQSQQANWNLYAKNVSVVLNNGQTRILSGFNWFVGANQLRLQAGEDVQNDAPSVMTMAQSPYGIEAFYTGMNTMAVKFNLLDAPSAPGSGDQLLIQIGRPQTLGTLYFKSPYQFVGTIDSFDAGTYVTLDVTNFSAYEASFSQSQWMRITRILPDGRYSTPTTYGPYRGFGAPDVYGFGPMPVTPLDLTPDSSAIVPHSIGTLSGIEVIQQGFSTLSFSIVDNELTISRSTGDNQSVTVILQVTGDMGSEIVVVPVNLVPSLAFESDPWVFSTSANGVAQDNVTRGGCTSATSTDLPSGSVVSVSGGHDFVEITNTGVVPGVYPFTLNCISSIDEPVDLQGTMTVA